ncbi:Cupin superfamily protein [Novymonas esmeraldas]|uniref:Cupin superfamily protein n=1 Tax=Novymonas esmeraldas TaxID=1808958 RepID=A0AAW0EWV0_9TRYP
MPGVSRWWTGRRGLVVAALLLCVTVLCQHVWRGGSISSASSAVEARWDAAPVHADVDSHDCSIDRVSYDELTADMFFRFYEERRPVILQYPVDADDRRNRRFEEAVQKGPLLLRHGADVITLSSGNRNSYAKRQTTVLEYMRDHVRPQDEAVPGNASWYHFGDPHHRTWEEVNSLYQPPTKFLRAMQRPALSFGFAGSGTGVPFHTHGAVFAEVLYGRKRWWLSEPAVEPRYGPDDNTLHWLRRVRPTYTPAEQQTLQECVCGRGDVLYIPSHWHHATLNVGETVFMSVFL